MAYQDTFDLSRLPIDVCGSLALPDLPVLQDCVSYRQEHSEIGGLIIRPVGSLIPITYYNMSSWSPYIDNKDPEAAHYIVGRGSFLPTEKEVMTLAGGRVEGNRERTQRLSFQVSNLNLGHRTFARQLQANKKDFTFWLQKAGGVASGSNTVIGFGSGMIPVYVDADILFNQGRDSREILSITIDTEFSWFPNW